MDERAEVIDLGEQRVDLRLVGDVARNGFDIASELRDDLLQAGGILVGEQEPTRATQADGVTAAPIPEAAPITTFVIPRLPYVRIRTSGTRQASHVHAMHHV